MKRKNIQNSNGIAICDSIVMSVKNKHLSMRTPISVIIAIIGFVSVIMSFLGMFSFNFESEKIILAAVGFSIFYITLIVIGGKTLWIYGLSLLAFTFAAYKKAEAITLGFKYVYNIIYSDSFKTEIQYYKSLRPAAEISSVTVLFFFYIWLLAIVIYFFTICRPNPILPLIITFPVIEIGLYNGIELPVFWGILTVAFWLALLAMSTIDAGEYSGGQGGFVRKNSLFFPKRQMKLKVTEKCGIFIISTILTVAVITVGIMRLTGYKRSDEINQKRRDITEAMHSFTTENLAESLSNLTAAFGFDFNYENHKLGTTDHVKYKNTTDLTVTVEKKIDGALYLKDDNGSVYHDNEWFDLSAGSYKNDIFNDFSETGIYPQDFPCLFSKIIYPESIDNTIWIKSNLKKKRVFAPYGTDNFGSLKYDKDMTVALKDGKTNEFTYKFVSVDADNISQYIGDVSRTVYSSSSITDEYWQNAIYNYCSDHGLITYGDYFPIDYEISADQQLLYENGNILMAELLQNSYKDFVYENYLQLPETSAMDEVRNAYSDILDLGASASSSADKLAILHMLRDKISASSEYSLDPGKTPSNRDFVNYFLLENPKGYCIHYATAGVILARMAGIPARYATGYVIVGDDFNKANSNPDGTYTIDVKDNRSHAWAEVYLDGYGWVPFEFTAGYSSQTINTNPPPATTAPVTDPEETTAISSDNNSRTTNSNQSRTTTRTSASTTANGTDTDPTATTKSGSFGFGNGPGAPMPKALKNTIYIIIIAALIVGLILLRRFFIIKIRHKRFTTGKTSHRIAYIYSYAEKLLVLLKLTDDDRRFTEFAKIIEERIGGDYFDSGAFEKLTDIALRSGFGNSEPTAEEIKICRKTVDDLAENLYKRSGFYGKFRMKIISVLI